MAAGNSPNHPPRPGSGFSPGAAGALLAICALLWGLAWATQGSASAWPRFEDDAYYYLAIARNAAAGHGFTADGLSPTNGFQPLWMWLLVPVAWLLGGATGPLLWTVHAVVVAIFAATGGLLYGLLRPRFGAGPAAAGTALLFWPPFANVLLSGMESGLAACLAVALVRELLDGGVLEPRDARPGDLRTGVLLGLVLLARLDSVFIAVGLAGYLAVREAVAHGPARAVRKGLLVFWPVIALLAPYLAWNQLAFGHLVPISGVLKTNLAAPGFTPWNLTPSYWGVLALVAAALAAPEPLRAGARVRPVFGALAVGLGLQSLHTMVFMHWAVFGWHFALFIPVGALAAAAVAHAARARMPAGAARALGAACAAALVVAQGFSLSRLPLQFMAASGEAGRWVAANLPPDARLGMKDSGAFGFFSERSVVNLDGVVNSFAYQEALCRGELAGFLREHRVSYVCQHAVPPEVRSGSYTAFVQRYPCHLPGGGGSELELRRDGEVYRGPPYHNYFGVEDRVVIWRVPP
ncbi:MAG TPA: hypothetical protein VMR31_03000 [Myxococcota bacterium]|nr:hypothetical protein [Myxococcota bacterium]